MDIRTAARVQGPVAHANVLLSGVVGLVGGLTIGAIRIARDGQVDGVSILLVVGALCWGTAFALSEALANRPLHKAAYLDEAEREVLFIFRVGQVGDREFGHRLLSPGWITLDDTEIKVWARRNRNIVWRCRREDVSSVDVVNESRSYARLRIRRRPVGDFEAIPVRVGIHNLGLGVAQVSELADRIDEWRVGSVIRT